MGGRNDHAVQAGASFICTLAASHGLVATDVLGCDHEAHRGGDVNGAPDDER